MRGPSWDVDGRSAVAELVVEVPEGRLVEAAERGIGRCIEHRFNHVVQVPEAQARVWVPMWGWLQIRPEKVLPGFASTYAVGSFF